MTMRNVMIGAGDQGYFFINYFPDGYLLLARIATRSERPAATTLAIFNFTTRSTVIKIAR